MFQRMISHPAGTFRLCESCRREPKHYIAAGRAGADPIAFSGVIGERHILECFCNGAERRTAFHPRLEDAEREWRDRFAVTALALKSRPRRAA